MCRYARGLVIPALLIALGLCVTPVASAQEVQPWSHPEVLRAALQIGLSPEQQPPFRQAVTTFLTDYGADVQRLLRFNQANLREKTQMKRRSRAKIMDEQVGAVLTAEQIPYYETYRDLLLKKMDERAAAR